MGDNKRYIAPTPAESQTVPVGEMTADPELHTLRNLNTREDYEHARRRRPRTVVPSLPDTPLHLLTIFRLVRIAYSCDS